MKINLAKSAGFCFGVKRAIDIAYKTLSSNKNVYMIGDIVHNEEVARKLKKAGIRKVRRLGSGKKKIFLIPAHGCGKDTVNKAKKLGYEIKDGTCPMVKEIQKIATGEEAKGYTIIIIGDKKHDEVLGIIGQLRKGAQVIESAKDIPWSKLKKIQKACVVVQSTQNLEKTLKIIKTIKPAVKELKFFNTICKPTQLKQQEIKHMPLQNDVMIIIGSKTSANTKRLYEISKSLNKRTYWVHTERNLRPEWFKEIKTVGITAGASTPDETTQNVVRTIETLSLRL